VLLARLATLALTVAVAVAVVVVVGIEIETETTRPDAAAAGMARGTAAPVATDIPAMALATDIPVMALGTDTVAMTHATVTPAAVPCAMSETETDVVAQVAIGVAVEIAIAAESIDPRPAVTRDAREVAAETVIVGIRRDGPVVIDAVVPGIAETEEVTRDGDQVKDNQVVLCG